MRKAINSLLLLVVSVLIVSTIYSFFTRDSFKDLSIKSSTTPVKLTRRMQETNFLVSNGYLSRYDYTWLAESLKKHHENHHHLLPVATNFYVSNQVSWAAYPVQGLDILDSDCNLKSERIGEVQRYFKSLQVLNVDGKKVPLRMAAFTALPESVTLRYSDSTAKPENCLTQQLIALGELSFLQETTSLVLPASQSVRVNLAPYERNQLLDRMGRNIYTAIAQAYKKNPAHHVRILLSNKVPYDKAQVLPFSELSGQFVGLTPEELIQIKNAVTNRNGSIVYIPDLANRVQVAIDTAVIWQLWQTPKIPFYKDGSGESLLYEDLVLALRKPLTQIDGAGVIQERRLKAIYASYARDNDEKRKFGESINLPYQRASSERLMKLQLQLLLDVYDFSAVGLEGETYVALEMPARQKLPLLHTVVRPLAKRLGLVEKKDGSDPGEIETSLELLRSTFAQSGK